MKLDCVGTRFINLSSYLTGLVHHRSSSPLGFSPPLSAILGAIEKVEPDYYWVICSQYTDLAAMYDCSASIDPEPVLTIGFVYQDAAYLGRYEVISKRTADSIRIDIYQKADDTAVTAFLQQNTGYRFRDSSTLQKTIGR